MSYEGMDDSVTESELSYDAEANRDSYLEWMRTRTYPPMNEPPSDPDVLRAEIRGMVAEACAKLREQEAEALARTLIELLHGHDTDWGGIYIDDDDLKDVVIDGRANMLEIAKQLLTTEGYNPPIFTKAERAAR